jgi:hypothetical protein
MVNLDDTSRCPVRSECEGCGHTDELAVSTADTPAGVICMQVLAVEEVPGDTSPAWPASSSPQPSTTPGAPPPHRHRWPQAIV